MGGSEPLESDHSITAKNPYDIPGKPDVPVIDDWDDKSVTLKWKEPKSNGGAPITGYVIEAKEKFQTTWNELLTTDTPALTAKVPDLREGTQLQFRIRAVNKAGPGDEVSRLNAQPGASCSGCVPGSSCIMAVGFGSESELEQ